MQTVHPQRNPSALDSYESVVRDPFHVRHFRDDPVPRDEIEHMVDLALCAASACPTQTWRFLAVQSRGLIRDMQTAVLERFEELALRPGLALQQHKRTAARAQALMFAKAPLCVAVLSLPSSSPMEELMELAGMTREEIERLCVRPELQSAGAAVQLLTTSAHAMGYAACWTCGAVIAGERLEEFLEVKPPARLVALVGIGRPAEQRTASRRLSLTETLSIL